MLWGWFLYSQECWHVGTELMFPKMPSNTDWKQRYYCCHHSCVLFVFNQFLLCIARNFKPLSIRWKWVSFVYYATGCPPPPVFVHFGIELSYLCGIVPGIMDIVIVIVVVLNKWNICEGLWCQCNKRTNFTLSLNSYWALSQILF